MGFFNSLFSQAPLPPASPPAAEPAPAAEPTPAAAVPPDAISWQTAAARIATPFKAWHASAADFQHDGRHALPDPAPAADPAPVHPADALHAPPAHWQRILRLEQQRTRHAQQALATSQEELAALRFQLADAQAQQQTLLRLLTNTRAQLAKAQAAKPAKAKPAP